MALQTAYISTDVYSICLSYALSTEKEETLALLLGAFEDEGGKQCARVERCHICTRKDKRKDRVEISPEQV